MPILLGELNEGCPQRLGCLLDELFEIDDLCQHTKDRSVSQRRRFATVPSSISLSRTVFVHVRALENRVDLLVLNKFEAHCVQGLLDFLLVK